MAQTSIYDTDDVFPWERIQTITDDETGQVLGTRTTFDAGYEVFSTYENGVLVEEFTVQSLEALGFDNRLVTYDTEGQITFMGTVYPNDLRVTENFDGGVRTTTLLQDGFYGDGALNWSEISITYDNEGNIATRQIKPDSGSITLDLFEPGVFETRYDYAQTNRWEFIDKRFNENGDEIERAITYDNGEARTITYVDGIRSEVVRLDQGNAFTWDSIVSTYDTNGALTLRETISDDAVSKIQTFDESGARVSMVQTDNAAAKNWQTVTTFYEDGNTSEKRVDFDNGDVTLTFYDGGNRTQAIQWDGDDSASWFARVIDFDVDGNRSITKYDTFEDIPQDIRALAPDITAPIQGTEYVLTFDDGETLNNGDTVLDDQFVLSVGTDKFDLRGSVLAREYGGANVDLDLEGTNSKGAKFEFASVNGDEFILESLSLANSSRDSNTSEQDWANSVTIEGFNDGVLVHSIEIDLTFDHVTHDLDWSGIDQVSFGASDNGFGENLAIFSFDDLVFVA